MLENLGFPSNSPSPNALLLDLLPQSFRFFSFRCANVAAVLCQGPHDRAELCWLILHFLCLLSSRPPPSVRVLKRTCASLFHVQLSPASVDIPASEHFLVLASCVSRFLRFLASLLSAAAGIISEWAVSEPPLQSRVRRPFFLQTSSGVLFPFFSEFFLAERRPLASWLFFPPQKASHFISLAPYQERGSSEA